MNNTSKRIVSACLALAMVASVGAADVSGILPVVKPVTASAEGSDKLADGDYYVNLSYYNSYDLTNYSTAQTFGSTAKLNVKDGKYYITLSYDASKYKDDENYRLFLVEKVKDSKFSTLTEDPGYADGLIPSDVDRSVFTSSQKKKISDKWNEYFDAMTITEKGDGLYDLTFEVDPSAAGIHVNMMYQYTNSSGKKKAMQTAKNVRLNLKHAYSISDDIFDNFDKTVPYNYEQCLAGGGYIAKGFKYTTVHAKAENGKIYATYYYDYDAVKNQNDDNYIGSQLKDADGNNIVLNDDKSFTVEYSTVDELVNGKTINVQLKVFVGKTIDGVYTLEERTTDNFINLKLNLADESVKLTDPTTGVSVLTTTEYVSKNAVLVSSDVSEDDKAYSTMEQWVGSSYDHMMFKHFYIIDNGKIVTTTGGVTVMEFPVDKSWNKLDLGVYYSEYDPEYDFYSAKIYGNGDKTTYNGYLKDNDTYMFTANPVSMSLAGYWGFFDYKDSSQKGDTLEDGTYEVPITIYQVSNPSSTSMANGCVGSKAKLVVKDGKKRIELDLQPVQDSSLTGYLIQMWYYDKDNEMHEVKYTSYYKNEDGSYFTDDLNAGTNNYYPKTCYIELPNDDSQIIAKFRVSAMDAIMGNSGDATRNGIFTIYYDEAVKISDETPDPDPEENPNFEPADMTALTALVEKAEKLSEDDYTTSTFTTMKNALASAKTVLANSKATQEEVDSAAKELQTAIDALEEKKDVTLDINNLPDGKYQLYAQMIKTDRESFSMSNEGINHTVQLEVVNGEYYITVQFKGLAIYNQFGYLQKLSYYDKGYTYNEYGIPQGTVIPAEVLTSYDIVDRYNDKDNLYPQLLKFKLVDKASEKYVPLQVFVPIMEAIADGTGTQDVLMQLDWTTIKATDKDIDIEEPDAQSPVLDYTDSTTGVKLHADKGVFAEGTTAVVKEITSGSDYDSAKDIISAEAEKFHLYDISFKGADGEAAQPNGKFSISLPVPSDYANPVVYRIADGKKTLISGKTEDGMFTFSAKEAGQYLIEDKLSANNDADDNNPNDNTQTDDNKPNDNASDNKSNDTPANDDKSNNDQSNDGNTPSDDNSANGSVSDNPSTGAAAKTGMLALLGAAFAVMTKKRKDR